jgi:glycerol kinase
MEADAGRQIAALNVDGGASANNFLMQFQADILDRKLRRPQNIETTALGAAFLAGLSCDFWSGTDELSALRATDDVFVAHMDRDEAARLLAGWNAAVRRTIA